MPKATEFAPIDKATLLTSAEPSKEKDPVISPVVNVTVLDVIHFPEAPELVEDADYPQWDEKTPYIVTGKQVK